jgi:hypothetical protein
MTAMSNCLRAFALRPVVSSSAVVLALCAASLGVAGPALGHESAGRRTACRPVRLTGLTVSAAEARAARAGCPLRLHGAHVKSPEIQTIAGQTVVRSRGGRAIAVWVNQLCLDSADPGPPAGEPRSTPGPTGLVSGLYLDGGPLAHRSARDCESISGTPGAGMVTVSNPATGAVVASQSVANGQLAKIPLPAGTYTLVGTYANAFVNDQHMQSRPVTVTIAAGESVRQDISVSIP